MVEAQRKVMEIERCALEAVAKRRRDLGKNYIFGKKVLKFQILNDSCGHRRNKTMIGMLNGWKIGRILLRKKTRLLKQGLFLCF
jgi:hypothetical protein